MKFSKEEKKFWQTHYHIEKPSQIFKNWEKISFVDSLEDDTFFYFFTSRVTSILDVYIKDTLITDKTVEYMTKFNTLRSLFLRKHKKITKSSITSINKMNHLQTLNITKTKITLNDLCESLNNQSLKEIFLDSDENEDNEDSILEKAFILKQRMPKCNIYLNCSHTIDAFGMIEKPIF
jgi:hypothetical protein